MTVRVWCRPVRLGVMLRDGETRQISLARKAYSAMRTGAATPRLEFCEAWKGKGKTGKGGNQFKEDCLLKGVARLTVCPCNEGGAIV